MLALCDFFDWLNATRERDADAGADGDAGTDVAHRDAERDADRDADQHADDPARGVTPSRTACCLDAMQFDGYAATVWARAGRGLQGDGAVNGR